jgi:phage I-like protein
MSETLVKLKEAIEINAAEDGAKQKISPVGAVTGFDGRSYLIDAKSLVANAVQKGVKIPLLVEHGYGKYSGEAAGWIDANEIEAREDGLYARVEKNALGEELIGAKSYIYYSPAYRCDYVENTLIVRELMEVSLTNTPNLAMPEANDQNPDFAAELNAQIIGAQTALAEADKKLTEANGRLDETNKRLSDLAAENRALKVDLAIERNQIWPKDREFALGLSDDQLAAYIKRSDNKSEADRLGGKSDPKPQDNDRAKRFVAKAINPNRKEQKQ